VGKAGFSGKYKTALKRKVLVLQWPNKADHIFVDGMHCSDACFLIFDKSLKAAEASIHTFLAHNIANPHSLS
jgi:hypothetical protein